MSEPGAKTIDVLILGTKYVIYMDVPEKDDPLLKDCAGYCDYTSHRIVICRKEESDDIDDFREYQKRVVRHEIIHAFLFESGLGKDAVWWAVDNQTHPEQMVDWMARQFPKMLKAFEQADAI